MKMKITTMIYFCKNIRTKINLIKNIFKNVCVLQMLYFNVIDVSEGTDVKKTTALKECLIRYYWYFLNYSFKVQPTVCHRCLYFLMMPLNLGDNVILNIKGSNYCCIILA